MAIQAFTEAALRVLPCAKMDTTTRLDALNRRITIDACRNHHVALRHLIDEFPGTEPINERHTLELLVRLRTVLHRHLRLEDSELYPALQKAADPSLRRKARRYQLHMGSLATGFQTFYEHWSREGAIAGEPQRFLYDWKEFRDALLMRMDSEDEDLYLMAERLYHTMIQAGAAENPQ